MELNGLQHIGIPTDNFEESRKFYETLGFELIRIEQNGDSKVGFYKLGGLVLEIWEAEPKGHPGAIDHFALDTDNIESVFVSVKKMGVKFIDKKIQELPFWENGIQYFNFYGPNKEIIEICQKN